MKTTIGFVIASLLIASNANADEPIHDGFQFRMTAGVGELIDEEVVPNQRALHPTYTSSAINCHNCVNEFSGGSGMLEAYLGHSLVLASREERAQLPAVFLGAMIGYAGAPDVNTRINGQPVITNRWGLSLGMIGGYLDIYPNAAHGFHFTGIVGAAKMNAASSRSDGMLRSMSYGETQVGMMFGGLIGYDWFLGKYSDSWNAGVAFRLTYAGMKYRDLNGSLDMENVVVPALVVSLGF